MATKDLSIEEQLAKLNEYSVALFNCNHPKNLVGILISLETTHNAVK